MARAAPPEPPPLDGVVLVDKPAGISSHAVVAAVRRAVGKGIRVGHAGTLDPFATGLMLVLVGRATRTSQFAVGLDKRYETLAQLGALSTTGDPEGEITQTGRVPASPLDLPTGQITQRPPAYSAIKIDGKRAYQLARAGHDVDVPERTITVYGFDELERAGDQVRLAVHCSTGTYIRTLVADLQDGYCLELRRTAVGPWSLDDAVPLNVLTDRAAVEERLIPLERALPFMPSFTLPVDQARAIHHGRRVARADLPPELPEGVPVLILDEAGVVAIGQADGAQLHAVVGFRA
ncbi:MAG: tRNA pseudouridine(55) synthase TruB [Solirubrobacteraceae bacterium]|nr:tRNA pseudouridine(55) synthase TruB [Solirubrobacteraceae bacterium]